MDQITRGEIWVVEPPNHPKPRPAIILSINPVNDLCPDVIVVPITTKPGPLRVALPDASGTTGLKQKSYAKCEALGPVHKSRLKSRIGTIPFQGLHEIETGVKRVLGLK
ncbi:MAG: type II toxin-antitoxin system PemK/MazF family toxin [Nitrospirae bacterium]|nr:type II toxin-antitoxin system PemK/MazF family toxin [Nitrospirota bacterium]